MNSCTLERIDAIIMILVLLLAFGVVMFAVLVALQIWLSITGFKAKNLTYRI